MHMHTILVIDIGLLRELNPGPLAPGARIMPLDQAAIDWYRKIKPFGKLRRALPCRHLYCLKVVHHTPHTMDSHAIEHMLNHP